MARNFVMSKKIKDTGLGKWLKSKAPKILDTVGELLPDKGGLGIVKNLLDTEDLTEQAEPYLFQAEAEAEVTKRWTSDSQNKLSSMVRPIIVLSSCLIFLIFALLDAFDVLCVKVAYINLLESLLLTSVGGYFVLRSADKYVQK